MDSTWIVPSTDNHRIKKSLTLACLVMQKIRDADVWNYPSQVLNSIFVRDLWIERMGKSYPSQVKRWNFVEIEHLYNIIMSDYEVI